MSKVEVSVLPLNRDGSGSVRLVLERGSLRFSAIIHGAIDGVRLDDLETLRGTGYVPVDGQQFAWEAFSEWLAKFLNGIGSDATIMVPAG
jgi:hypothetical protein